MLLLDIEPKKVKEVAAHLPQKRWRRKKSDNLELLKNEFMIGQLARKLGKPVPEYRMTDKGVLLVEEMRRPNKRYMHSLLPIVAAKLAEFHAPFIIEEEGGQKLFALIHGDLIWKNVFWGNAHKPLPHFGDLEFGKVMRWDEEAKGEQARDIKKLFASVGYKEKEKEEFLKLYKIFSDVYTAHVKALLRNAV